MPNLIDLTGQVFTRLTVLSRAENAENGACRYLCQCECGNQKVIYASALRSNLTRSCGCLDLEMKSARTAMAAKRNPEYVIWKGIKNRCYCTTSTAYCKYGARGIAMCDSWRDSFEQFFEDMGRRPSSEHSIERRENDGNYEPSNCYWATRTEQARNKRMPITNTSGITGVGFHKRRSAWQAYIRAGANQIFLGYFKDFFEACCARKSAELKHWAHLPLNA